MAQSHNPSLITKNLVFCGDAAMKSAAGPATLLYDKVNDNNGTMYNANCVDFDATDTYVTYGDVTWLDGLSTVSVSSWFYLDIDPPEAAGILVSKDNTLECALKRSSSREYSMSINNNHRIFASAPVPALGEWIHMVMTWTNTSLTADVRKLYLNGELVDTDTGGDQGAATLTNSGQHLGIGGRPDPLYNIDAKIADTKIFSKELSAANVKELYDDSKVIIPTQNDASGAFLSQGDLLLWAPLTDGVGSIAYDGSGHGRDGTYEGTSFLTGQTGAPQLIEGYNGPMLFNGSSDYVTLGAASVAGADYGTVSAWVYLEGAMNDHATIYTCQVGASWANMRLVLNIKAPNTIRFHVANGTNYTSNSLVSSALNYNQWYHVAGTYNGTDAKIYIDGSLDATYSTWVVPGSFTPGFTGIGYMDYY